MTELLVRLAKLDRLLADSKPSSLRFAILEKMREYTLRDIATMSNAAKVGIA